MGWKWILLIMILGAWLSLDVSPACANGKDLLSQLLAYVGKSYKSVKDPEYLSYDLVLRTYLVKRIKGRFGIALDPKTYSGFDLLEIEAFFKCKKNQEPFDLFLKKFPKGP